jgi:iron complex outermembrane receptor protein
MKRQTTSRACLAASASGLLLAALACAPAAYAQEATARFDIPAQPLAQGLLQLGRQANISVAAPQELVAGRRGAKVSGELSVRAALERLLSGSGLRAEFVGASAVRIVAEAAGPQVESAGPGAETTAVDELIVTAQKKEERIQDVPIAISAFSGEALNEQKIEGGFDLMKAIPNVTFSKSNFTSYNLSIRGIGTKAVSATSDPGVAVSFNSVGVIQNRLFEQEYFDVERVEVLRGPQGTLYGRNATAGVVNVISEKPDLAAFEGSIKAEVGNYDSRRLIGMVNLPLVEDKLAVRFAGSMTERDGYDYNAITDNSVNGRDLWSTRLTIGFEPNERFRANFVWERFKEDDNRSRTGKQLCHRDDGPTMLGSTPVVDNPAIPESRLLRPAVFSTGCQAGSLYDKGAYGTPNGLSFPYMLSLLVNADDYPWSWVPDPTYSFGVRGVGPIETRDPYDGQSQSRDLRQIASIRDPIYRANADIFQLNMEFDLTDSLTLTSQTARVEDSVYSFQDFNRFNTQPFFRDTTQSVEHAGYGYTNYFNTAPGGVFCDPQIGCTDRMAAFDISRSEAEQFTQEFRLSSSFAGPVNFSVGANYTRFKGLTEYFVMNNVLTALAMTLPFNGSGNSQTCDILLPGSTATGSVSMEHPDIACPYIDPNPAERINGEGHNYFRSINPYKLQSTAVFGEVYWDINDTLSLTAGLRYTDDRKTFTPVPTQLLLSPTLVGGGLLARGFEADPDIKLKWGEWTGRLGLDWKPDLSFTDETLIYGAFSRGYKGGGANPPSPGFASGQEMLDAGLVDPALYPVLVSLGVFPILSLNGLEYDATFKPEFVNAFEIGAKNTLLDGRLIFNATAFYYDYTDYQLSQIRNRTAVNENFDANVWGLEFETVWKPTENLRINANLGYLQTRIADGEQSIDIMNRNLGNPDYTVVRSWMQIPANCIVPTPVAAAWAADTSNFNGIYNFYTLCGGVGGIAGAFARPPTDPATGLPFDMDNYPELNNGSGFYTDLSGNELPNAPRWTFNIGAQYGWDLGQDWRVTARGDFYWQDQSYHRVYNYMPYDRLKGWTNANLSVWFERSDDLRIEVYVKNLFDETPITDAFLNSDDAGLTTNVFTLDPRLIGVSIRKGF